VKFRKTPFFENYQDDSVPEMLIDLGLTKSILIEEGHQSLAPIIKTLQGIKAA